MHFDSEPVSEVVSEKKAFLSLWGDVKAISQGSAETCLRCGGICNENSFSQT